MDNIILIGGGGHCRSVIDVIELEKTYQIAGILDKTELVGSNVFGYEVIGSDVDLADLSNIYRFAIVTVGQIRTSNLRRRLFRMAKEAGFILPVIISSRAYVSKHATIGEGSVVMHDALVNANVVIGKNCIINTKALIEHDCHIKDNCHVSTGAVVNGSVHIGKNCFIGSNSSIRESMHIQEATFIKSGILVK